MSALRYGVQVGAAAFGLGLAALVVPQLVAQAAADARGDGSAVSAVSAGPAATAPSVKRGAPVSARVAPAATGVAAAVTKAVVTSGGASGVPAASVVTAAPPQSGPRFRLIDLPASAAPRKSGPPAEDLLGKVLGTQVTFVNQTGEMLAVVQVPGGGRNDPEAAPWFIAPGLEAVYSGDNWGYDVPDVRLRVYTAVKDAGGSWQKGGMVQIFTATNSWVDEPRVWVHMDPKIETGELRNRTLGPTGFSVGESWNADYTLRGPIQSGQTANYVERAPDGADHKVFIIATYTYPNGFTQDYPKVR